MIVKEPTFFYASPVFVKLSGKEIKLGKSAIKLRDFQYELLKRFMKCDSLDVILLSAPTGAGKTLSLLIPLFANIEDKWIYHGSVGIYPSRELAKDQMISIYNLLIELGASPIDSRELYGDLKDLKEDDLEILDEYIRALEVGLDHGERIPIVLLHITSESLNRLREVISKYKQYTMSNKELLEYLREKIVGKAFRIIFTVPEYPYLLATDIYQDFHKAGTWLHAVLKELVEFLKTIEDNDEVSLRRWFKGLEVSIDRKRIFEEYYISREFTKSLANIFLLFRAPVFFDEFHLYSGFSLASFISLLYIFMYEKGIRKIVVSSATPTKTILVKGKEKDFLELVRSLAERMGYSVVKVSANTSATPKKGFAQIRKRTLVKVVPVLLEGRREEHVTNAPAFGILQRHVHEVLKDTDWLRMYEKMGRSMIIVDRVASVLEAKGVVEELTEEEALPVCSVKKLFYGDGQQSKTSKTGIREAKLIVGNMAIAFGVDIKGMDLGVVFAKNHLSALQRIGRFGRGGEGGEAIVYLPIPFSKYREVEDLLKEIEGEEVPYISTGSSKRGHDHDFVTLLKMLYPQESPDIIVGQRVGIFKAIFPTWVYVLANIIRERSEVREQLHIAKRVEDVKYLHHFVVLLEEIETFFEIDKLERKLQGFVRNGVYLTPIGLYNLYSYRNITEVPISTGDVEKDLDLITIGRNIPLAYYNNGRFWVDKSRRPYEYTMLWIGVSEADAERIKSILEKLDGRIFTFYFLVEVFGGGVYLLQGGRNVCRLTRLSEHLQDTPVLLIYADSSMRRRIIEYLSATASTIPIYTLERSSERKDLLGGMYLL